MQRCTLYNPPPPPPSGMQARFPSFRPSIIRQCLLLIYAKSVRPSVWPAPPRPASNRSTEGWHRNTSSGGSRRHHPATRLAGRLPCGRTGTPFGEYAEKYSLASRKFSPFFLFRFLFSRIMFVKIFSNIFRMKIKIRCLGILTPWYEVGRQRRQRNAYGWGRRKKEKHFSGKREKLQVSGQRAGMLLLNGRRGGVRG